jgi:hypothetical protein
MNGDKYWKTYKVCESMSKRMVIVKLWVNEWRQGDKHRKPLFEMNSNMWSVLTNSKSADFFISMLHQMFTTGHTKYGQYSN